MTGSPRASETRRSAQDPVTSVAIFVPSLAGGGAERVMINLAQGLIARGVAVDLLVGSTRGPYRTEVPAVRRLVDFGTERTLGVLPRLVRYLRSSRPGVLLSALDHANCVALWAVALAKVRVPTVITVHVNLVAAWAEEPPVGSGRLLPRAIRWSYPRADAVVAVSRGAADALVQLGAVAAERIHAIHNPLVSPNLLTLAQQPVAHEWFNSAGTPVFLGIGRLVPQKDFVTLIRAFAWCRRHTPARLLILGEGPERARLGALIQEFNLDGEVQLSGFVNNPYPFMRGAAAVVLSSRYEGFGNVLVEAMACGTPVVSTDCPSGPSEILAQGEYGPLVPVGDARRLGEAMLSILRNRPDASRLRARAAAFSIDAVVAQYLQLIGELTHRTPHTLGQQ